MRNAAILAAIAAAAGSGGCFGLSNLGVPGYYGDSHHGECRPFGGVRGYAERMTEPAPADAPRSPVSTSPAISAVRCLAGAADVSLSFAVDFFALPYCLYRSAHPGPTPPVSFAPPPPPRTGEPPEPNTGLPGVEQPGRPIPTGRL